MSPQQNFLTFKVSRQDPELITPAKPTPTGLKDLSDMDDVPALRFHVTFIQLYRRCDNAKGKDPVKVIKEAIAQALVYYYPLAGRLREIGSNKKVFVDCSGEGVMFVAADADVTIDEFGEDVFHPPFPGTEKLISDEPKSMHGSPLLHFQVTRLKCGGFIVATLFNHIMADGYGIGQFLRVVSEMARGLSSPSIQPVWDRHLLRARDPPRVTFEHRAYDLDPSNRQQAPVLIKEVAERNVQNVFLFDEASISSLRELVAPDMPAAAARCTTFELIGSTMWRAWVLSQKKLDPATEVQMRVMVNARTKFNPPIHPGYYGNLVALATAVSTAGELEATSVGHAAHLVQKAKHQVTEDFMRSMIDLLVLHNGPPLTWGPTSFTVSDFRRLGLQNIDYGWGKPVYGGAPNWDLTAMSPGILTCFAPLMNSNAEEIGTIVPVSLPEPTMDSFIEELNLMTHRVANNRTWKKTANALVRWAKLL